MTIKLNAVIHKEPLPVEYELARFDHERVMLVRVLQEDGSYKWAVYDGLRRCLSTKGEWTFEPMPSSRPHDWIRNYRFGTFQKALEVARPAIEARLKELQERVDMMNAQDKKS